MKPHQQAVKRIVALGAVLGVVFTATGAFLYGPAAALSVLVGAIAMLLNLVALGWLVPTLFDASATRSQRTRAAIILSVKFIVFASMLGVLIVNHWVRGTALAAGLSVLPLAIVVNTLTDASREGTNEPDNDSQSAE